MTDTNGTTAADTGNSTNLFPPLPQNYMPMTLSASCPPVYFVVPFFGGEVISPNAGSNNSTNTSSTLSSSSTSSYHDASDQAHIVLGILLLAMVFAWASFVLEICRVRWASKMSGYCQTAMGVYLYCWLFVFMAPNHLEQLLAYTLTDLLQLQHLAIASLLCAGGIIELLQSSLLLPPMSVIYYNMHHMNTTAINAISRTGSQWHVLWSVNLMLTGLLFMLHPQHSYGATVKHILLGISLVIGSPLLVRAKGLAWKYELDLIRKSSLVSSSATSHSSNAASGSAADGEEKGNHVDWSMIAAGGSFALAASILLAFREQETEIHVGTTTQCQPSFIICVVAYIFAGLSTLWALYTALGRMWASRNKRINCCRLFYRRAFGWSSISNNSNGHLHVDERDDMIGLEDMGSARRMELDEGSDDIQLELSPPNEEEETGAASLRNGHQSKHRQSTTATSNNHELRATYGLSSSAAPNGAHSLGDMGEYEEDDDFGDTFDADGRMRELAREKRRQEQYTGEDDEDPDLP